MAENSGWLHGYKLLHLSRQCRLPQHLHGWVYYREDREVVRKVGVTLKRLNIEESFTVSYRLGLFPLVDPETRVFVDLVYGHEWSDPVLDMVGEGALVTGHSVHVLVNPATSQKVEISDEWRTKLRPLTPLPNL